MVTFGFGNVELMCVIFIFLQNAKDAARTRRSIVRGENMTNHNIDNRRVNNILATITGAKLCENCGRVRGDSVKKCDLILVAESFIFALCFGMLGSKMRLNIVGSERCNGRLNCLFLSRGLGHKCGFLPVEGSTETTRDCFHFS